GNRMIGVSRRQRWTRRSDGSEQSAQYRYYQCESRTNQSRCDYHTRRAEALEQQVRTALLEGDFVRPVLRAGDDEGVRAETEQLCEQLRSRAQALDKRLEALLDAAVEGRLAPERLRSQCEALARDRQAIEDRLADALAQLDRHTSQREREARRRQDMDEIALRWESATPERRQEMLRRVLDRVVVHDERLEVHVKP
ncbi:MAG TPA: zinc ribbon domain-containing protein, partial [Dehalococcoidia bacterium]|nr:zinc ribbon domain-containing protein [Dehalococcoidia bacterium]